MTELMDENFDLLEFVMESEDIATQSNQLGLVGLDNIPESGSSLAPVSNGFQVAELNPEVIFSVSPLNGAVISNENHQNTLPPNADCEISSPKAAFSIANHNLLPPNGNCEISSPEVVFSISPLNEVSIPNSLPANVDCEISSSDSGFCNQSPISNVFSEGSVSFSLSHPSNSSPVSHRSSLTSISSPSTSSQDNIEFDLDQFVINELDSLIGKNHKNYPTFN